VAWQWSSPQANTLARCPMQRSQDSLKRPTRSPRHEYELDRCPACLSERWTFHAAKASLLLAHCKMCGVVFLNPQPRQRVLEKYQAEYDLAAHFQARADRKRMLFKRRLADMDAACGRRLCDVACGDGQFLELARDRGWVGTGVELNPTAAARARERGFSVSEGVFEDMADLDWGSYPVVTSWDTLEHTPEPRKFATGLARLLTPTGTLFLTTLNLRSLAGRLLGMRWSMIVEDHFTYWTASSLTKLLSDAGLQVTRLSYFGLGRDFVRALNRPKRRSDASARPRGADWSASRPTATLEACLNYLLDGTRLGVGIAVEAHRAVE
jgi:2-polyprenyl-3-methyl-5-hydroxy-6-metoxy-1,4-benzoquinol methylase